MKQYLQLVEDILANGAQKGDRTGSGTLSVFGRQLRFDLAQGFPLVTTKKIHLPSVIHELLWFLRGETNIAYLRENKVTIWDEWADDHGDLGPIYGHQWRSWPDAAGQALDQIEQLLTQLKTNPNSRRMLVSAWNVADLPDESLPPQENVRRGKMALAPCHALFQFYVTPSTDSARSRQAGSGQGAKLSCQLYQRSCDTFLGLPFNIASYALLTHMLAQQCDLDLGEFVWTGGDVHLYLNHLQQARLQLSRTPYPLPRLEFNRRPASIFEYRFEDFAMLDYQSHPPIKAPIAI